MPSLRHTLYLLSAAALLLSLMGCTLKQTSNSHPLLAQEASAPHALVYFLRPATERAMGYADNALAIRLDKQALLKIDKGRYTAVKLQPRNKVTLSVENMTEVGPDWQPKKMVRDYTFTFEAGGIYYISLEPVDGEFRGVYFLAKSIDRATAYQLAKALNPTAKTPRIASP